MSWFIGGNFNIIRSEGEKLGGNSFSSHGGKDFNECIQACGLRDIPYSGNRFSWCNGLLKGGRIWACLDRVLVNAAFITTFPYGRMEYLPCTPSNHSHMITKLSQDRSVGSKPFRFQRMRCDHANFLVVVCECWNQYILGCPMVQSSEK